MRKSLIFPVVSSAALMAGLVLTGCTSATHSDQCVPSLQDGALSKNITVLGGFGVEPKLNIPEEFTASNAQRSTLVSSNDRAVIADRDSVLTVNYALFDSETGEAFEMSENFEDGTGHDFVPLTLAGSQGSFLDSLECAAPGDRILTVFSPAEAADFAAGMGLAAGTNIIAVTDVHGVGHLEPNGKAQNLPSGFPSVVQGSAGEPGVVVAPAKAPSQVESAVLIPGFTHVVAEADAVVANFMGVTWQGEAFINTWQSTGPQYVGTVDQPSHDVRGLLTGAEVGSRMVYLVPDDAGSANIFVVDILAAG